MTTTPIQQQKRKKAKAAATRTAAAAAASDEETAVKRRMTPGMRRRKRRTEMKKARLARPREFFPLARVGRIMRLVAEAHNGQSIKITKSGLLVFQDLLVDRARLLVSNANGIARDGRQSKTTLARNMATAIRLTNAAFPTRHHDASFSFAIGKGDHGALKALKA